jgi:hypothetical protein
MFEISPSPDHNHRVIECLNQELDSEDQEPDLNLVQDQANGPTGKDQDQEGEESESEDNPLLFVDVNLGPERAERIVVYDGDTAEGLAEKFS